MEANIWKHNISLNETLQKNHKCLINNDVYLTTSFKLEKKV